MPLITDGDIRQFAIEQAVRHHAGRSVPRENLIALAKDIEAFINGKDKPEPKPEKTPKI